MVNGDNAGFHDCFEYLNAHPTLFLPSGWSYYGHIQEAFLPVS
jgi:hypothetical protein